MLQQINDKRRGGLDESDLKMVAWLKLGRVAMIITVLTLKINHLYQCFGSEVTCRPLSHFAMPFHRNRHICAM